MDKFINKFSERLKELRLEKELSQRDLVIKLKHKITQPSIAMWEQGKRIPTFDSVILLAQFFNVSLDYLAGLVDFK